MTDQKICLTTTTGELFLPTRIVYRVHDREQLAKKFRQLRCMRVDEAKRRWTWNYEFEAGDMGFPSAYDAIPPERRPIVLASCYEVDASRLHVYVRSTLRLTKFLVFFDRHISRRCAEGEFFDEYNLITVYDPRKGIPAPEDYFRDESKISFLDVDEIASDPAKAPQLMDTHRCLEPLERHRLTAFYEDGEEHMVGAMKLREVLAVKQHQSDNPIRPFDVILEALEKPVPVTEESRRVDHPATRQPTDPPESQDWARLSDEEFVGRLFTEADQLPMGFSKEAIFRGKRILPLLAEVARDHCTWHRSDAGWWAPVHAVYLLGAIGGEAVVGPLIDALRIAEEFENEWVLEELPSIFGNLGPKALGLLRAIALDAEEDWMLRHTAMACMAGVALKHPEQDAETFQLIGRIAGDTREDDDVRAWAGKILIDCARREHKGLLWGLVDSGITEGLYGKWDVRKGMWLPHLVHYRHDWLEFYQPDQVSERRRRRERSRLSEREAWQEALSREWGADPDIEDEPLDNPYDGPDDLEDAPEHALDRIFAEPKVKIGRNDHCPCGSGKKFKKCCLNRPAGHA